MALIGHHLRISWPAGLLVLLATFVSLRWGEATALRRRDLDLNTRTVRIRAAYVERSTGEMLLGPPKSKAGRRVVGVPDAIVPALRDHLAVFVKDEPGALIFPGAKGGPLRRGNFNKMSAWPRGCVDRHDRSPFSRPSPHREPVRSAERRRAPGPDGPDGA